MTAEKSRSILKRLSNVTAAQNLLRKAGTSAQLNIVRPGITDNQQGMKLNRSSSLGSSGSGLSIRNLKLTLFNHQMI